MDPEQRLRETYAAFNARDIDVRHTYAFRDGLVERMDVTEP